MCSVYFLSPTTIRLLWNDKRILTCNFLRDEFQKFKWNMVFLIPQSHPSRCLLIKKRKEELVDVVECRGWEEKVEDRLLRIIMLISARSCPGARWGHFALHSTPFISSHLLALNSSHPFERWEEIISLNMIQLDDGKVLDVRF